METEKPKTEPKRETAQTDKQGGEFQTQEAAPPPISEPIHSEAEEHDAEEPKAEIDREQDEKFDSIGQQTKWMEQQTGWMAEQTKLIRRQFWAALVLGVFTFGVLIAHGWIMSGQLDSMNSSSKQTQDLIEATRGTANASQSVAEQNKELVRHAGEQANASRTLADASQTQAKAATDQAKASQTQAETAKQSIGIAASAASAAQQSAKIAQESMVVSTRPYVIASISPLTAVVAGETIKVSVQFSNDGNSPAEVTAVMHFVLLNDPLPPKKLLITDPDTFSMGTYYQATVVPPHRDRGIMISAGKPFTADDIKAITHLDKWLIFYGEGSYKGVGGKYPIEICLLYHYNPSTGESTWHDCLKVPYPLTP